MFVAYLSALCQQPAAHGDAIRAADRLGRGRAHVSFLGRRLHRRDDRLGWFFVICALAGLPSLMLLWWLQMRGHFKPLVAPGRSPIASAVIRRAKTRSPSSVSKGSPSQAVLSQ